MRLAGGFFSALLALSLLSAALLYGANFYLRGGGAEIGEIIRGYAPEAEVRFSRGGLRLTPGAAAFRAENLEVKTGGAEIAAPRADFWLGADGVVAVLHSPDIVVRGGAANVAPFAGKWAAEARRATVRWLDEENGVSLTLQNALLRARHEDGRLLASVFAREQKQTLRAAADLQLNESGVRGIAEVVAENAPPELLPPPWNKMRATVRATIDGTGARLSAAGDAAAAIRWRADGHWDGAAASLTISAAADSWIPFADAAAVDAFLRGTLRGENGGWRWRGDLVAAGEDGAAGGEIRARGTGATIADAAADLQIRNMPAASLWKYAPHPETREWLAESVAEGSISAARLHLRGSPSAPRATLAAAFSDGRIRIAEGWPDAENLGGILRADETEVVIAGKGEIGGAAADSVRAHIPLSDAPATLHLRAAFNRAPLRAYLAAARALPPARAETESAMRALQFDGDGQLSLSVDVPLADAENAAFNAFLTTDGNAAVSAAGLPPFSAASGTVQIDGDGVHAYLRGRLADAAATVSTKNENAIIQGEIPATLALQIAGAENVPASGAAEFTLIREARRTVFLSNLRGAEIALPPPLAKTAEESAHFYAENRDGVARVSLRLRDNIFRLKIADDGADIAINTSLRTTPAAGARIYGTIGGAPDAAGWLARGGGGNAALSIVFADAAVLNMPRQTLTLVAKPPDESGAREIALHGGAVSGTVFYRPGAARAELSRLHLGEISGGGADIGGLSLAAAVRDFRVGGAALGALILRGAPAEDGWILATLRVENGENALAASGHYDGARTELTVRLAAPDAPAVLSILGQNNVVSEGGATLAGGMFWPGAPPDFSLDSAQGRASLLAEDLRYLKSEQGVISLLAVFSPQSLLELGFTELGKEGTRINTMRGEIALRGGAAEFRDILMENDDLHISLRGETDLRARTLNISGRVRPGNRLLKAGSVVGIGAVAAVQPIPIAAGWFLGKIFEKPLSEIGAYDYTVTGVWDDPVYTEIDSPAVSKGGAAQ